MNGIRTVLSLAVLVTLLLVPPVTSQQLAAGTPSARGPPGTDEVNSQPRQCGPRRCWASATLNRRHHAARQSRFLPALRSRSSMAINHQGN